MVIWVEVASVNVGAIRIVIISGTDSSFSFIISVLCKLIFK